MELVVIGVIGQAVALIAMLVLASQGPAGMQAIRIRADGRETPAPTDGPDSRRIRLLRGWLATFVAATFVATAGATGF